MGKVRPLALVTTVASLASAEACTSWQKPHTINGVPVFSPEHAVRATLASGAVVVLENPRIVGDSLIGDIGTPPVLHAALAMSEVKRLEEKRLSAAKNGGLAVGCGAILLGTLGLVLFASLLAGME